MPREQTQEKVLARLKVIQEGKDEPVWISGRQMTELLPKENPSSVRMALLLLCDKGLVNRERKKGRGPKGKTGQSSWYSLTDDWVVIEEGEEEIRAEIRRQEEVRGKQKGKKKRVDSP